jgi:FtsH-binding integral membrane protein
MALHVFRFLSLLGLGVEVGLSLSHTLQWSYKRTLPYQVFLPVQVTLYNNYWWAGAGLLVTTLVATMYVAVAVRKDWVVRKWAFVSLLAVVLAFLVWLLGINPLNHQHWRWTPEVVPADWEQSRDRWHLMHAIRLGVVALGMGSQLVAVLLETRQLRVLQRQIARNFAQRMDVWRWK